MIKEKSFRFHSIGLRTRVSIIFVIEFFVLMSVMTLVLYQYFRETVRSSIQESIGSAISSNVNGVYSFLERVDRSINLVNDNSEIYTKDSSAKPRIYRMLSTYKDLSTGKELLKMVDEYKTNLELFNDYFAMLGDSNKGYASVLFVEQKFPISEQLPIYDKLSSFSVQKGIFRSSGVEESQWYQMAVKGDGSPYWFKQKKYPNRLCMAQLLRYKELDGRGGVITANIGVIILSFDVSWIADQINLSKMTGDSGIMIADESGKIIYSDDDSVENYPLEKVFSGQLNTLKEGNAKMVTYKGNDSMIQVDTLPKGLTMVTVVPTQDMNALAFRTIRIIIIMAVVITAAGIIITIALTSMVVKPIRRLSNHMEKGSTDKITLKNVGNDEIGVLYNGFNSLMEQVQALIADIYRSTEEKKRSQLQLLQAQINPHFVYNTLDTVCCLALLSGEDPIADILTSLGKMMRYNTKNPDELVPLAREIETIRQYEVIQKACYQESISFLYNLDEEASDILIPKLIIQPLVENAIVHGMDFRSGSGIVSIITQKSKGQLIIEVEDNGKNSDIDSLNLIVTGEKQKTVSDKVETVRQAVPAPSGGLGIHNVYERLWMVYGNRMSFVYNRGNSGNTVARITLKDME